MAIDLNNTNTESANVCRTFQEPEHYIKQAEIWTTYNSPVNLYYQVTVSMHKCINSMKLTLHL